MKKSVTILLALLFVPSVSSAAALTQQQANSLIAVVQSSPGTPASAFVSLITSFSNITVTQATSLITVVQASPGTPASAFVNLLTSFTVDTTSAINHTVTPVAGSITCNGKYYSPCTNEGTPVCLQDGSNAYCQPPQPPAANVTANSGYGIATATSVTEEAVLTPLNNQINQIQTQSTACISRMGSNPVQFGSGAIMAQSQAAMCQNISSELSVFLAEKDVIQHSGVMTLTCSQNISNLTLQIYDLRQKALGEELGELTSGSASSIGQGNAQRIAQTEAAQEAPLLQQVQQNLYYCQN